MFSHIPSNSTATPVFPVFKPIVIFLNVTCFALLSTKALAIDSVLLPKTTSAGFALADVNVMAFKALNPVMEAVLSITFSLYEPLSTINVTGPLTPHCIKACKASLKEV
ncbi:MAG: hypothetical protein BWY27_00015 [Bacteroidetes bacterium ADurb.Bin234]|nr:MAG: hypothetical protein BWY27_00015 [Bacteroidetes bacterium ADurb.Bin234]